MDAVLAVAAEIVKALLIPGSVPFLLLGMTVAVILLLMDESRRARGRGLLAALVLLYWILSLPITAKGLETVLADGYTSVAEAGEAQGARTVVVLGGGSQTFSLSSVAIDVPSDATAYRVLEADRLYRLLDHPLLILSGGPPSGTAAAEGEVMRELLAQQGVTADQMVTEIETGNTHEQAVVVAQLLAERKIESFILVTSPIHMRRAVGAFAEQGLHPIPSVSSDARSAGASAMPFLPSEEGLRRSQSALREIMALIYYSVRGWMGAP
ncbi:MAG TPA: YdcF family protein [Anaerolineales bacterium]|nr:YdcF family protein [Anaerolineales bacterium]